VGSGCALLVIGSEGHGCVYECLREWDGEHGDDVGGDPEGSEDEEEGLGGTERCAFGPQAPRRACTIR